MKYDVKITRRCCFRINLYPETYWYNGEYHNGNCTWYCWKRAKHQLGKKYSVSRKNNEAQVYIYK